VGLKPSAIQGKARLRGLWRIISSKTIEAIRSGEQVSAKRGRLGYCKNFQYERLWGGRYYPIKQVLAIVAEEPQTLVVVTVYTFYF